MAKTIKGGRILLELDDGRTIELFAKKTKKAKGAVDDLAKSEATLNRNFKGASQQSSNTTKNFSKMAQGITGGLVPAYATLAANIFAISAAFRFLQDAANYRILIEGQLEYARTTGEGLATITRRLREATGGQLAFAEAAQAAAIGRAGGLSSDQLARLATVAKNASIALGRDLTDSFQRLIRGVTKAEPELLDELGIILRLNTATEKYAREIGKSANALNIFEKSQAVANEVLDQGETKFGEFNTQLNEFNKLATSFDDLINKLKKGLSGIAEFIAGALSRNTLALAGAMGLLGTGIASAITPDAPQFSSSEAAQAATDRLGGFYKGKRDITNMGAKDLDALTRDINRAYDKRSSTVIKFNKLSRREALQTVQIIRINTLRAEAEKAGVFKRVMLGMKAEYASLRMEHGKTMAFMTTTFRAMGRAATNVLKFAGYVGILFTVLGLLKEIFNLFRDKATTEFAAKQIKVAESFKATAKEINNIISGLKVADDQLTNLVKRAKLGNLLNFAGMDALGTELMGKARGKPVTSLGQYRILEGVRDQIQSAIDIIGNPENPDSQSLSATLAAVQKALNLDEGFGQENFKQLLADLKKLENEGIPSLREISKLADLPQIIKNAGDEFEASFAKLRKASTPITTATNALRDMAAALKLTDEALRKGGIGGVVGQDGLDAQTLATITSMIGLDAVEKVMRFSTGSFVGPIRPGGRQLVDPQAQIREFFNLINSQYQRFAELETRHLTQKTMLQEKTERLSYGEGKLTQNRIKQLAKIEQIQQEITRITELRDLAIELNQQRDQVTIDQENATLAQLETRLQIAKDSADLLKQVGVTFRESFEAGMATAFQSIIEGTKSVKEAFGEMAKMILKSLAQILAQQAAIQIMQFIPGLPGIGGRYGGIMSPTGRSFAQGGIPSGPESGYPVTLHGTEAVVPLGNDRHIPVKFENGGSSAGPVTVNVNMTSGETETTGEDQFAFGKAIASAVQQEIAKQQRPGGTLSPY